MAGAAWRLGSVLTLVGFVGGCTSEVEPPPEEPELRFVDSQVPRFGDDDNVIADPTPPEVPVEEEGEGIKGTCAPIPNAHRLRCEFAVDPPALVRLTLEPVDGARPPVAFESKTEAPQHVLTPYFLTGDTDYFWTAERIEDDGESITGSVRTSELSSRHTQLDAVGTSSSPMVGMQSPCSGTPVAVIHDTKGELIWEQQMFAGNSGRLEGLDFTEDGTVLASGSAGGGISQIGEWTLDGFPLIGFQQGVDFEARLHHDLFRRDDLTYALTHETIMIDNRQVLLDGLYVFDASGLVGEWWLTDEFTPTASQLGNQQGTVDFSHANAVWVDRDGAIYLSMRHLHSIVKLGAVGTPEALELQWVMAGGPSVWQDDVTIFDLPSERQGFLRQHNFHRLSNGQFAMFDNRLAGNEFSRLLVFDLDQNLLQMTAREAYELPQHCAFQGGSWFTDLGNPMATCAPTRQAFEFSLGDTGTGTNAAPTVWEATVSCLGGQSSYVPRFVPLDW